MKVATQNAPLGRFSGLTWLLVLLPLLLVGAVMAYIVTTGAGLSELTGPPVERVAVERITLPAPGMIQVEDESIYLTDITRLRALVGIVT